MGRSGDVAFAVVVLAAYLVYFTSGVYGLSQARTLTILLLGLPYVGLGLVGSRYVYRGQPLPFILGYLAVEIALGGWINYLAYGSMWLLLLPIAGQAIESLPGWKGYLVCALIWAVQILPMGIIDGWRNIMAWGPALVAAIVFVAVFTQSLVNEQKARVELAAANQKLRDYAAQVEELATTQERNRLAREIHDGLGHYLTAVNIQIKAAQSVVEQNPALAQEALNNAQSLTQEALADVRRSISALRADPATSRPLAETLTGLILETRTAGIQADLNVSGAARPLPPQVEFTLYRVAQEGLTNVRKHARAARADLRLEYLPTGVRLTICDDGVGAQQMEGGFGLLGVQERVQLMGGTLKVTTAPGQGFCLAAELPA